MITGSIKNIIIFTFIILIHELGHLLVALLFKWKIDKIYIYPFGGCIKFIDCINKPLLEELIILIGGPLLQIIVFLIIKECLVGYSLYLYINYNFSIILFNLIPIYPLDGGRLLNIILCLKYPYKKSLIYSIFISFVVMFLILFNNNGIVYYLILVLLFIKVVDEYNCIDYYYNKFLLERYLYNFKFKKRKVINNEKDMMKDKRHIIKYNGLYNTEKYVLSKKYKI